ncbi:MAG: hypothetical protein BWY99_02888 [Synergistetes bacterium ADurb.BinA166]|nr:MAG: hypothetical protein BWY99_02888 [Synergistetes bacterium ADurb.BinA166]
MFRTIQSTPFISMERDFGSLISSSLWNAGTFMPKPGIFSMIR